MSANSQHSRVLAVINLREGLDRASEMSTDDLRRGDVNKKVCSPAMGAVVSLWMLESMENELVAMGVDPKQIPGTDWLSMVNLTGN